jgi:alanyl-tRNA synthetase
MKTRDIRRAFIEYFERHGHRLVPSSPVVPKDDPTLLFTNAGMNQFKDVFLGREKRDYTRAVSSQKCIRAGGKHNDLEQVGHTARHQTFFEMLGNFSFGDYFKDEAIARGWEFLTGVIGIDASRLWISVFESDDEAADVWKKVTGFSSNRIARLGEKDNFWQMADTGPCGPCTEIHYDRGQEFKCGAHCGVGTCDCGRFLEVWNLVFMQYDRQPDGTMQPLPRPSVDTGMGLERLASVIQDVPTNFDIDLLEPLLLQIQDQSGVKYKPVGTASPFWEQGVPHRVIADHVRTLSFAIADGALPSNEGAGYVLRRILRRAARYGRKLKIERDFMHRLVPTLVDAMGDDYPELRLQKDHIRNLIRIEEESFGKTLDRGLAHFESVAHMIIEHLHADVFPGDVAFKLYDTYGFPPDLTRILAREKQLEFDEGGFDECLQRQRERSREASSMKNASLVGGAVDIGRVGETEFLGYQSITGDARVLSFSAESGELVLDRTPFYAESGGQVGDRGVIEARDGSFRFRVRDTQKAGQAIVHLGELTDGDPEAVTDRVEVAAHVDPDRRDAVLKNHTATHLMHWALQQVLGEHARQAGSVVDPERLRFDFSHFEAVEAGQLQLIEEMVNAKVLQDITVRTYDMALDEAKSSGVTALFGEKYGDQVRVVDIGGFSRELCGGTHVTHTGEVGLFKIVQETAVQAGVRRIVALTGMEALRWVQQTAATLAALSKALKAPEDKLLERVEALQKSVKEAKQQAKQARTGALQAVSGDETQVGAVTLRVTRVDGVGPADLKQLGASVSKEQGRQVVALFAGEAPQKKPKKGKEQKDKKDKKDKTVAKMMLLVACSRDAVEAGLSAAKLLNVVTGVTGGRGGGKKDFAQAGGEDPAKLGEAIEALKEALTAAEAAS